MKKSAGRKVKKTREAHSPAYSNLRYINEAGRESFPSSDPPSWTLGSDFELFSQGLTAKQDIAIALFAEHELIRYVIVATNKIIVNLEQGKTIDTTNLKKLIQFFTTFVDNYHYQKEEIIFKALQNSENRPSAYLLNDLKHEHEHGKLLHADLKKLLPLYDEHPLKEHEHLLRLLKSILHLHRNHTAKEEAHIFPLIRQGVDEKEKEKILQIFTEIEQEDDNMTYENLVAFAKQLAAQR